MASLMTFARLLINMVYIVRFASGQKVFESESEDTFENELESIVESMPFDIVIAESELVKLAIIDNGDF